MTNTLDVTDTYKKAHELSVGLDMIGRFDTATRQGLADDNILLSLYDLLEQLGIQDKLLHIDDNITINTGFDAGTIKPTAGTIGLVLSNNQDQPVTLASVTPNSNHESLIIDCMQPTALVIGTLDSGNEIIAIDNTLEDAVKLAYCLMTDNVTLLVSLDKLLFNSMVSHFAEAYPVTIFTTLDKKDKACKPFKGENVKAILTSDRSVLEHLEYGNLSYRAILADDETIILDLQAEIWSEPEPLANETSKPTAYPINAFTGLLRQVIEAVAYYAQVPLAMAGQCVLGALAHMGQRFIDAPFGHGHKPASLILITEGESGSGKTEAMNLTHFKIDAYEQQQYEQYLIDLDIWETEKASLKGGELKTFLDTTPKPYNPETVFKEATIETILDKYVNIELVNGSWATDDAAQFFNGHSMTSKTAGNALTSFTDLYSGGVVNRSRSQKNAFANPRTKAYNARFTLMLMAQRIILEPALSDPLMNGQGFLARALIACSEDLRGYRTYDDLKRLSDDPHNNPYLIEYWSRCHSLLDPLPAKEPNDTTGTPQRLKIKWADKQTEQVFYSHMQTIENRQKQGGVFATVKAYASRMAENASRIASLMAFFEGRETITTDDITRAFMLVEYSTAERLRYLDATPTGQQNDSEKLSSWLVDKAKGENQPMLNRTDAYNGAPKPMRKNNKLLQNELDNLESMGHIRQTQDGKKKVIYINPKLY